MPQFAAPLTNDHPGTFERVYHIEVDPPEDFAVSGERARAFITNEVDESHVAKELAVRFGAAKEGEQIEVILRQTSDDGSQIAKFSLPVTVKYATTNRGTEYLQIGLTDVDRYFDVFRYEPIEPDSDDEFLWLTRKSDADRDCFDIPAS